MCLFYDSSSSTHFIAGLVLVGVLFSYGVALAGLGEHSYRLSTCPVEPALSLWMMTAGVSLLFTTTLAFIILVCNKSGKHGGAEDEGGGRCCFPNLHRTRSVLSIGWAFCCGILGTGHT